MAVNIVSSVISAWGLMTLYFSAKNTNQLTKPQKTRIRWGLIVSCVAVVGVCLGMAFGMGVAAGVAIFIIVTLLNVGHYLYYRKFHSELKESEKNKSIDADLVTHNRFMYFYKLTINEYAGVDAQISEAGFLHWTSKIGKKMTFQPVAEYSRTALIMKYQQYHDKLLKSDEPGEDETFFKQLINCVPVTSPQMRHLCREDTLGRNILHYLCMDPDPKKLFSKEKETRKLPVERPANERSEWLYRQNIYFLKMVFDRYNSLFLNRAVKAEYPLSSFLEKKDTTGMTPLAYATTAYLYGNVTELVLIQKLLEYGAHAAYKVGNVTIEVVQEDVTEDKEGLVDGLSSQCHKAKKDSNNFSPILLSLKENKTELFELFLRCAIKNDTKKLPIMYKVKRFFWKRKNIQEPISEYYFKQEDIIEFIETILSCDKNGSAFSTKEAEKQAKHLGAILKYAGPSHANYKIDSKQYSDFIKGCISNNRWDLVKSLLENSGNLKAVDLLNVLRFSLYKENSIIAIEVIDFIKDFRKKTKKETGKDPFLSLGQMLEDLFFEALSLNSSKLLGKMTEMGAKVGSFVRKKYSKPWDAAAANYLHGALPFFNDKSSIATVEIECTAEDNELSKEFIVEWFLKHIPPNLRGSADGSRGQDTVTRILLPQEDRTRSDEGSDESLPYWVRSKDRFTGDDSENELNRAYQNLLHWAMGSGNTEAVCSLMLGLDPKTALMLLREPDTRGLTPLHYAAQKGFFNSMSQMFTLLFEKMSDPKQHSHIFSELIFDTYDKSGKNVFHTLLESSKGQSSDENNRQFSKSIVKEYYVFVLELKQKRYLFRTMLEEYENREPRLQTWSGFKLYDDGEAKFVKTAAELEEEVFRFFIKHNNSFKFVQSQIKFHESLKYIVGESDRYNITTKISQVSLSGKNALHYLMCSKNIIEHDGKTLFDLISPYCTSNSGSIGKMYIKLKPKQYVIDDKIQALIKNRRKILFDFFKKNQQDRDAFDVGFDMLTEVIWTEKPEEGEPPLVELLHTMDDKNKDKVMKYYQDQFKKLKKTAGVQEKIILKDVPKMTELMSALQHQDIVIAGVVCEEGSELNKLVRANREKINAAVTLAFKSKKEDLVFLEQISLSALCQFAISKRDPRLLDYLLINLENLRKSKRTDKKNVLKNGMGNDGFSIENLLTCSIEEEKGSSWNVRVFLCLSTIENMENSTEWSCHESLKTICIDRTTPVPVDPIVFLKKLQVINEDLDSEVDQKTNDLNRLNFYKGLYFEHRDVQIQGKIKTKLQQEYSKVKVVGEGYKLIGQSYERLMKEFQTMVSEKEKSKKHLKRMFGSLFKKDSKKTDIQLIDPKMESKTQKLPLIQYLIFSWLEFSEEHPDLTESVLTDLFYCIQKWKAETSPYYQEYILLLRTTSIIAVIHQQKQNMEKKQQKDKEMFDTIQEKLEKNTLEKQIKRTDRVIDQLTLIGHSFEKDTPLEIERKIYLEQSDVSQYTNFPEVSFEEQLMLWCQLMQDFSSVPTVSLQILMHQRFFKNKESFFVLYSENLFRKHTAVLTYFHTLKKLIQCSNPGYQQIVLELLKDLSSLIQEKQVLAQQNIDHLEIKKVGVTDASIMKRLTIEQTADRKALQAIADFSVEMDELQILWSPTVDEGVPPLILRSTSPSMVSTRTSDSAPREQRLTPTALIE